MTPWMCGHGAICPTCSDDAQSAIADFQIYLVWAPKNDRSEQYVAKRQQRIENLREDVDPFDADTLKALEYALV